MIRGHEIQPSVPIHIGDGDASGDQRFGHSQQGSNVLIPSIGTADINASV